MGANLKILGTPLPVIPAKAGIQLRASARLKDPSMKQVPNCSLPLEGRAGKPLGRYKLGILFRILKLAFPASPSPQGGGNGNGTCRLKFPAVGIILIALLLTSCAEVPKPELDQRHLTPVSFSSLSGWSDDRSSEALPSLAHSCHALSIKNTDWKQVCVALTQVPAQDNKAARAFFERWFQPYAVAGNNGEEGLFTGYYEAELRGAWQQGGAYQTPLYARPADLITVDLGAFKTELHGQHLVGKVEKNNLKPYDDRIAITGGSLSGRAQPLMWVDDPVDAFFLAIQGSGRVRMSDGTIERVGYDSVNGRAYVAIGRELASRNDLQKPVTMQTIRAWLKAHPDQAQEIMNLNPSYVFFHPTKEQAPIGAEGVALTPNRSMAVDPAFISYGTPLWVDTLDGRGNKLQKLVVAQDTGGAIKGVVRGDFFWGFGTEAEAQAGAMQSRGRYYVLLPKTMNPDVAH